MPKEHYITGLDIGSANIRAVQAKAEEGGVFSIIGTSQVQGSGMRKGVVVDIEECVSAISKALENLERMTGIPVTKANISIGGGHISTVHSHGVIAVSRADGEVSESDIVRCVDASQAISIPQNKEVLHVFPKTFTLDGQAGIRDPLGMSGIRLEVDTVIVQAGLPFVKNLSRAVMQAGIESEETVLAVLAAGEAVLTKRQKDLGVVLVDLGAGTTSMAVYEEGDLLHAQVLPVGSLHITNDIAIGLRCMIDTAEQVKVLYGNASPKNVEKGEEISLKILNENEDGMADRQYVAEIIEARLEEILGQVQGELRKISRDGKLPSGVVFTGGGAHMPGLVEMAKKYLRLPASISSAQNITTVIDRAHDPAFSVAAGLAIWGGKFGEDGLDFFHNFKKVFSSGFFEKVKHWAKNIMP